ncbi:MAG: gamma-glutamyltransferase [Cyclobacteriaceae bacterium]
MNFSKFLICILLIISSTLVSAQTYARNGMVVSTSKIASDVGMNVLKKGGNVIDATVATAFALAVTYPSAGNIGGGGFIVYMNASGNTTTFDFREKAPLAASNDMFLDDNKQLIEAKNHYGRNSTVNHAGLLSVGVPGTVAGLFKAHQKYGKLPWAELVQPAIDLATNGFEFNWTLYMQANFFRENSPREFLQHYFDNTNGEIPEFGATWKQPALATTLTAIRDKGHDGFYSGKVAKEIAKYMKSNGGLITTKDLAKYEAIERKSVSSTYKDFTIHSMPPPSSGGITLINMLNLIEQAPMDSIAFNSADYVHLVAEVMRRGFADRAEHLGDPDFNPEMPVDKLISKAHAAKRFAGIDMTKASPSDSSKFGALYDGESTTHFSVMDKDGNAVSMTYTLEHGYGSGMGSSELGFLFNNEMGDFNPVPGLTTNTGKIGTAPNLVAPEKRMLSSMTPTIISKDGRPVLVIGSPGGRTIINTVFQTILAYIAYDMRVDLAIEALKIHHQWLPDRILYEKHLLSPDTRNILEERGHQLHPVGFLGRLMGIQYDWENHILIGAADNSSPNGGASGY